MTSQRRLPLIPRVAALLAPAGVLLAVDLLPMEPTPPKIPAADNSADLLVDRVIPGYGVREHSPYRQPSRIKDLYHEIRAFAADLDARVMSGKLALPADRYEQKRVAETGALVPGTRPSLIEPAPLREELMIIDYLESLAIRIEDVPLPNHYEQWQIDNSWRDLARSGDLLTLAIGDTRYLDLREKHRYWKDYWDRLVQAAIFQRATELIGQAVAEKRSLDIYTALAQAEAENITVPYPKMKLDPVSDPYPPVFLPAIPGFANLSETARTSIINNYGIPGQPMKPGYPADAEAPVVEAVPELDDPSVEDEEADDAVIDPSEAADGDVEAPVDEPVEEAVDDVIEDVPELELDMIEPEDPVVEEPAPEPEPVVEEPAPEPEPEPVVEEPAPEPEPVVEEPAPEPEPEAPAVIDDDLPDFLDDSDLPPLE